MRAWPSSSSSSSHGVLLTDSKAFPTAITFTTSICARVLAWGHAPTSRFVNSLFLLQSFSVWRTASTWFLITNTVKPGFSFRQVCQSTSDGALAYSCGVVSGVSFSTDTDGTVSYIFDGGDEGRKSIIKLTCDQNDEGTMFAYGDGAVQLEYVKTIYSL